MVEKSSSQKIDEKYVLKLKGHSLSGIGTWPLSCNEILSVSQFGDIPCQNFLRFELSRDGRPWKITYLLQCSKPSYNFLDTHCILPKPPGYLIFWHSCKQVSFCF